METWLAATGMALGVLLVLEGERRRSRRLELIGKPLASALFVWLGLTRWSRPDPVGAWMLVALLLCAIGDVLLIAERTFDAGLLAFLAGHLGFAQAFRMATPVARWPLPRLLLLAVVSAGVLRWLWPRLGRRRLPVLAYVVAITLMVWGAVATAMAGTRPRLVALGATLFFASDVLVARQRFVTPSLANRVVGLPAYYAGQLLLALCI